MDVSNSEPQGQTFSVSASPAGRRRFRTFYLCILLAVFAAYLPVLHGYYLHTDDYFWSSWGDCPCGSIVAFMSTVGRPLAGLLYCIAKCVHTLDGMNLLRALSALNVAVLGILMFRWLSQNHVKKEIACCIAILIVTLPPFQVYVAYLSTAPYGLSVMLSMLALGLAAEKVIKLNALRTRALYAGVAVFLLVISASLYQPGALFYVAMLAVPVIMASGHTFLRDQLKPLALHTAIVIFALALYYAIWRLGLWYFNVPSLGKYDGRILVPDFMTRATWFVKGPLFEVSNLWDLRPWYTIPAIVGVIVCSVIALEFVCLRSDLESPALSRLMNTCCKWAVLFVLLPVSFAASLASASPSTEYRTYCCLSAFVALACLLGIWTVVARTQREALKNLAGVVFAGFCIFAVFQANRTVEFYFAFPDSLELRYIKREIRRYQEQVNPHLTAVNVITVPGPLVTSWQRNECGEPSARHGPNIGPMVTAALRELGINYSVQVTHCSKLNDSDWTLWGNEFTGMDLPKDAVPAHPEDTLIVDMSNMRFE